MHLLDIFIVVALAVLFFDTQQVVAKKPKCPRPPIRGPFYLTVVPKSKDAPSYPVGLKTNSDGVDVLWSAAEYKQQFLYDLKQRRIFKADDPTKATGDLPSHRNITFEQREANKKGQIVQVPHHCGVYLLKSGLLADHVKVWWSEPLNHTLKKKNVTMLPILWEGLNPTADPANAGLRVDVAKPTGRI